ncbi:MAG: acyl carrier protein [Truepera sp.]|jgi:acyl carrier protein|nr:acyl carrier protein [Truepera sp.]HRQ11142.1 acyl carrier protein [Trueperaceae bacterium]
MAADVATIDKDVRQFLADNFILDDGGAGLEADESLTQAGVLDSMGVLELIMFIEQHFEVSIPDEDTLPENLDSVSRIVGYVSRRLA